MERIFKTKLFGGFNKKEVIEYIDEMFETQLRNEKILKIKIKDLEQEKAKFVDENNGFYQKIEKYSKLIEDSEKIIEDKNLILNKKEEQFLNINDSFERQKSISFSLNEEVSSLKNEVSFLKNEVSKLNLDLDNANNVIIEKNAQLQTHMQKSNDIDKFKQKQKEIQAKINDFVSRARMKADSIVNDAKGEKEKIIAQAKIESDIMIKDAKKIKKAVDDLKLTAENIVKIINNEAVDFNQNTERTTNVANSKFKNSELNIEDELFSNYDIDFKLFDDDDKNEQEKNNDVQKQINSQFENNYAENNYAENMNDNIMNDRIMNDNIMNDRIIMESDIKDDSSNFNATELAKYFN